MSQQPYKVMITLVFSDEKTLKEVGSPAVETAVGAPLPVRGDVYGVHKGDTIAWYRVRDRTITYAPNACMVTLHLERPLVIGA